MAGFRERILTFNKHILNPVTRKVAGARYSPFALIRHVGRRSGKRYETPITVRRAGDGFVIALTYGPEVDWLRNLVAAGGGTLRWNGKEYAIGPPEPLDAKKALSMFSLPERLILRRLHIQHFRHVQAQVARSRS